jgi:AcrR family transcriptional regulator
MTASEQPADATPPRRRADAERNIARILDAAVDALAENQDASMAEIARRAGVVRATIYVHYPNREALLDAVTEQALTETAKRIDAADPDHGDPVDAIARIVTAAWRTLGRYHALVALNVGHLDPSELRDRHSVILGRLAPVIERGQVDGHFRADVPVAWHLSMMLALVHAASGEVQAGRVPDDQAEAALVSTVLGALAGPQDG